MSRFLRRSISSGRRWANILAICSGVTVATLAADASAWLDCGIRGPVTAGLAFSGAVGSINSYTSTVGGGPFLISWGDGTNGPSTLGNVICRRDPITGITICTRGIFGTHTYANAMNGVQIKLTGAGDSCTTPPFDVVAAGPPPPGNDVLSNPKLMLGGRKQVTGPVTGVIAIFTDSNPSAVVSDFTALIDWGDGTQSDGVVSSPRPGTLEVSAPAGGHTYAIGGKVTVSVSLSAPGVTASTATGTVRVGRGP